jgi:uncharacterized protein YxeA
MNSKTRTAGFLIGAVLIVLLFGMAYSQKAADGLQNITSTVNTARYILFCGTYQLEGHQETAVFKLDTYTGKTWILKIAADNGKKVKTWIPVDPDNTPAKLTPLNQNRRAGEQRIP